MFKEQSVARGEQTAFVNEMIENQKVVKAFGYEDRAEERFDEIVGVTIYQDSQAESILLWVAKEQYPYIKTKPIHGSQREIKGERLAELRERYAALGEGNFIELNCIVNYELEQLLMSFMDKVVVLSPESLVKEIAERVQNLSFKYKKL